jgi:hypothetical protein
MLKREPLSLCDDTGGVYISDNFVYRAINNDQASNVLEVLDCGLINELIEEGVFPETTISDIQVGSSKLTLKHERLKPLTYPYEWSPEMLKKAGLCVLKVNEIANKYGYELKDAHPYNIVFKNSLPKFVDFGSFTKRDENFSWGGYKRFLTSYIYPLKLYSAGLKSVFNNLFLVTGRGIPIEEYLLIRYPHTRLISKVFIMRVCKYWFYFRRINKVSEEVFIHKFKSNLVKKFLFLFLLFSRIFIKELSLERLRRNLLGVKWSTTTAWGTYHERTGLYSKEGEIQLSERMNIIIDHILNLSPTTVLELAGNQGVLSRRIATLPSVKSTICSDYDENAIDRLIRNLRPDENVTPLVMDFMREPIQGRGLLASCRLKSDIVIVLAVMHHLILTQGYNIEAIFNKLSDFTNRHIIIEFMPLGLYNNKNRNAPAIPDWYNQRWFEENLKKYFRVLNSEQTEKNRILYVAEIIS